MQKKLHVFQNLLTKILKNELEELGVKIIFIKSLDSRYAYANKIEMLQIKEDYDVLITLDTDIIITGDFSNYIDKNAISTKIC